jgi:hypothetical protein
MKVKIGSRFAYVIAKDRKFAYVKPTDKDTIWQIKASCLTGNRKVTPVYLGTTTLNFK